MLKKVYICAPLTDQPEKDLAQAKRYAGYALKCVSKAPISVAIEPNKMSSGCTAGVIRFEIMHPINSPGIASGINTGRIVSASEMRNCITPLDSPNIEARQVSAT